MSKWYGKIAYGVTKEFKPGCWSTVIETKNYYGDLINDRWRRQTSNKVNDDINFISSLSILADQFISEHCYDLLYAEVMGVKWKITDISIQYPRILLTLGGKYNGK